MTVGGKKKEKLDVTGGAPLSQNPFAALEAGSLPAGPQTPAPAGEKERGADRPGKRGRIEIRREKSGRGGKTVTTARKFQGACPDEQKAWVAELRRRCGVGGTWKPGLIEIQGDRRDDLVRFFEEKGFRPVLAGG